MASYADFKIERDKNKTFYEFISELFGDCWCMMKTPEGFIFHLNDGSIITIEIQYVKDIFVGQSYMVFSFNDRGLVYNSKPRLDVVIRFDAISRIEILPDNHDRWG